MLPTSLILMGSSPLPPPFPFTVSAPAPAPALVPSMITSISVPCFLFIVVIPTTIPAPLPAFPFTRTYSSELTPGHVQHCQSKFLTETFPLFFLPQIQQMFKCSNDNHQKAETR